VSDTMVSAVVAGVLAGDIRKLSAYACFPVLRDFDTKSFSPLGRTFRRIPSMIRKRLDPGLRRRWRGLVSVDRGLGGLADAIANTLGERLVVRHRVETFQRESGYSRLRCSGATGGLSASASRVGSNTIREMRCRRVVLAVPVGEASRLLSSLQAEAAAILAGIESAPLTVINLAFRRADVGHPLDGFGFLVPHNEPEFPLMGVLWADSAFPHHAPSDQRLMRVFVGGASTPNVNSQSDEELVTTALGALRDLLRITGDPTLVDICAYPDAIPQYHLGHVEKIVRLRQIAATIPGLHLAGNFLDGVSINDCVRLGKQVAHDVITALSERNDP